MLKKHNIFFIDKKGIGYLIPLLILVGILSFMWNTDIVHPITVHHPGMKTDKDCRLIEQQNDAGQTLEFYTDVQSVICLDGQCKIVDVRLFWDRLGGYTKYELAKNVTLEKKDGEPFTAADYEKLQTILMKKDAVFKDIALAEVVDVKKDNGGIDGISGATILTDESASIKGAAWTCYTLWHWANGEICSIIKDITTKNASTKELYDFFKKEEGRFKNAAIQQFQQRRMYDDTTLNLVKYALPTLPIISAKLAIPYFKNAPKDLFFSIMKNLFPQANEQQRLLFLKALLNEKETISDTLLQQISIYLSQLKTYQEVNLVVDFLEKKEVKDARINEALLTYLQQEDFIIARRVFWFLNDQTLKPKDKNKVKLFEKKHEDSL